MNKNDLIGAYVVHYKNGVGTIKSIEKGQYGSEYLKVQFEKVEKTFPFPDIIAPKYNLNFRFVDEEVQHFVEELFREKYKTTYKNEISTNSNQSKNEQEFKTKSLQNTIKKNRLKIHEKQLLYFDTHAELLNYLLNSNYKAWMKSWYILNNSYAIWIISLDYQVRLGWRNRRTEDTIYENYVYKYIPDDPLNHRNRLCFSIHNNSCKRIYVFEGVFKYVKTENNTRIWQKISDTYTF